MGAECDPCRRARAMLRSEFPWGNYIPQTWKTALADYDFGLVFRQIRAETGWSQHTLGGVVDLAQSQISAIERDTARLTHVRLVASVARGLHFPGPLLGFPDTTATPNTSDDT